jgi:hypothetical protein
MKYAEKSILFSVYTPVFSMKDSADTQIVASRPTVIGTDFLPAELSAKKAPPQREKKGLILGPFFAV